jgi:hypothetical protein
VKGGSGCSCELGGIQDESRLLDPFTATCPIRQTACAGGGALLGVPVGGSDAERSEAGARANEATAATPTAARAEAGCPAVSCCVGGGDGRGALGGGSLRDVARRG